MTKDAKRDALAGVALLARCPDRELRSVAEAGDLIRVRRGTLLASPDDRPNPVVLLLSGSAHRFTSDGVAPCRPGELLGAAEELAGITRHEHIVAAGESDVLVIDPRRLVPLLERCPVLTLSLLRQVAASANQTAGCASSPEGSNGSTTRPWASRSRGTSTTTPSSATTGAPGT